MTISRIPGDIITADFQAALKAKGGTSPTPPILQLPYKGFKAVLKIGKTCWIMSKYKQELYRARRTQGDVKYHYKRYNWENGVYDMVHWESVGLVRRRLTYTMKIQTCKLMIGWLPVAYMRRCISRINQCAGGPCKDKTATHVFQCQSHLMVARRSEAIEEMRKMGKM